MYLPYQHLAVSATGCTPVCSVISQPRSPHIPDILSALTDSPRLLRFPFSTIWESWYFISHLAGDDSTALEASSHPAPPDASRVLLCFIWHSYNCHSNFNKG